MKLRVDRPLPERINLALESLERELRADLGSTVLDSEFIIQHYLDKTRQVKFSAASLTTATTRTYTLPDANTTLVGTAVTQTLTNKTIALGSNTVSGTLAQFNTALTGDNFVSLTGAETLTNKTLTAPVIADFTNATHDHQDADDGGTLSAAAIGSGTLALARGGTNADLSATGGTSQVLQQASAGAAITVGQLAASNLSNGTTGSGAVVLATSPTLVTPALGTPASGVLTNCTGTASGLTAGNVTTNANLTGPITSVGNATSIASQTGTGTKFVVDTSPTLVTPTLGVATATSIGIGGTQAVKLHVFGSGVQGRFDSATTIDARHEYYYNGGRVGFLAWFADRTQLFADTSMELRLGANNTRHATIDVSGNIGLNATSFGTSAAKVVAIGNGTAPTTSPADAVQLWAQDTVAGQSNLYGRNENGKSEQITGLKDRVATQFDKTSDTTLANITGLSHNVEAGKAYSFDAVLYTTSNVAGGVKFAIAGTATATSIIYEALVWNAAAIAAQTRATALGTAAGGVTAVTVAYARITGTIVVNAAGTLTVQFAQNASSGTASSVLVGSFFQVIPIGD